MLLSACVRESKREHFFTQTPFLPHFLALFLPPCWERGDVLTMLTNNPMHQLEATRDVLTMLINNPSKHACALVWV